MLTLLRQAIKKIGKDKIKEIRLRPCPTNFDNLDECGLYNIDIWLKTRRKYHQVYIDVAYIPIKEGDKYITVRKSKWEGEGEFEGIPIYSALTGGACLFCVSKSKHAFLEEILDNYEKIAKEDKYCLYLKPDLKELKALQEKLRLSK